jgi:hypothetical protein
MVAKITLRTIPDRREKTDQRTSLSRKKPLIGNVLQSIRTGTCVLGYWSKAANFTQCVPLTPDEVAANSLYEWHSPGTD